MIVREMTMFRRRVLQSVAGCRRGVGAQLGRKNQSQAPRKSTFYFGNLISQMKWDGVGENLSRSAT